MQNLFVVIASYVFYGWWDWRFLILITITAAWAWGSGLHLSILTNQRKRNCVVAAALVVNLGILGVFKYYNFFADNVVAFLEMMGFHAHRTSIQIILPVGISFYTFQAMSYVIDVYRGNIKPTKDLIAFLAFVSFFPQLVAGPIERATNLLPQFLKERRFDYGLAVEGCRQMLWGFFKKLIVADSCAYAANLILEHPGASSISLWVGIICFSFQIYGDFSGYSDIAIGCSKLFGIRLMRNFNVPYFSRDIAEFWRRWHISLTTWFRDYLYIPMGGSRVCTWKKIRNTFVIFLVSGFWHGANWTFIAWGAFHAFCFIPLLINGRNRTHVADVVAEGKFFPSFADVCGMVVTFLLVATGWTIFRAPDIAIAYGWLLKMFSMNDLNILHLNVLVGVRAIIPVMILMFIEWMNRGREIPMLPRNRVLRWGVYYLIMLSFVLFHAPSSDFIYFRF